MAVEIHPLKQWLEARGLQNSFVSGGVGVSVITVSRWFSGESEMRLDRRKRVQEITDGGVTRQQIEDWQANHLKRFQRAKPQGLGAAAL